MIFIVLKVPIRPEERETWLEGIARYAAAVRAEPGNIEFNVFESIDAPNQFSIVEAFASPEAGDAHVQTEHFKEFFEWVPKTLAAPPDIINTTVDGWNTMHELG
ncbi:MAG: putative quinol monooxygenase [Acidimicrobiia bacterium]